MGSERRPSRSKQGVRAALLPGAAAARLCFAGLCLAGLCFAGCHIIAGYPDFEVVSSGEGGGGAGGGDAGAGGMAETGGAGGTAETGGGGMGGAGDGGGGMGGAPPLVPVSVDGGAQHTCAVLDSGEAYCWGSNDDGQLGNGLNDSSNVPVKVQNIATATQIEAGGAATRGHSCALLADNTVRCWGLNEAGQLGDSTYATSNVPVSVISVSSASQISAGGFHSCAQLSGNNVVCWGFNDQDQLGGSAGMMSNVPVNVSLAVTFTAVSAGGGLGQHTCGLAQNGQIWCWGSDLWGQLGNGANVGAVSNIADATTVVSGAHHSCAILADTSVMCWGQNLRGQLGDGNDGIDSDEPVAVTALTGVTALALGSAHSCALLNDGSLRCWGYNGSGQLGVDMPDEVDVPIVVPGIQGVTAIAAGDNHSCAVVDGNTLYCWGEGSRGQLGHGVDSDSTVPVQVQLPVTRSP